MSLLTSASLWNNEETSTKKRVPTMRRTIKKPLPPPIQTKDLGSYDITEKHSSYSQVDDISTSQSSIQTVVSNNDSRNQRITELLNNMSQVNAEDSGQKLADFQPLSHPAIQKRTEDPEIDGRLGDEPIPTMYNPLQLPPPLFRIDRLIWPDLSIPMI